MEGGERPALSLHVRGQTEAQTLRVCKAAVPWADGVWTGRGGGGRGRSMAKSSVKPVNLAGDRTAFLWVNDLKRRATAATESLNLTLVDVYVSH